MELIAVALPFVKVFGAFCLMLVGIRNRLGAGLIHFSGRLVYGAGLRAFHRGVAQKQWVGFFAGKVSLSGCHRRLHPRSLRCPGKIGPVHTAHGGVVRLSGSPAVAVDIFPGPHRPAAHARRSDIFGADGKSGKRRHEPWQRRQGFSSTTGSGMSGRWPGPCIRESF